MSGRNKTAVFMLIIKNSKILDINDIGDWANYIIEWNNREYQISIHYQMIHSKMEKYTNKKKIDKYYKRLAKDRTTTVHQTAFERFESLHPVYGSAENSLGYLATEREIEIVSRLIDSVEDILGNTTDAVIPVSTNI